MTRSFRHWTLPIMVLGAWGWMCGPANAGSEPPKKYAVQLEGTVSEAPPSITLSWVPDPDALRYEIARHGDGAHWDRVAVLDGTVTKWSDDQIETGKIYEYRVIKNSSTGIQGFGHIRTGLRVPFPDFRGKIILLTESSITGPLATELDRLETDLIGDGWIVLRRMVSRNDSPPAVKEAIKAAYESDPNSVNALFLFGHIPVPYSGDIAPDGHENHQGAWPADTYYGDMDGDWTDQSVDTRKAEREINWNTPGDGKFDPSQIPSDIELMVGRVDLSNMTCYANKAAARSEVDLLRQYLNKDHAYRIGAMKINRRALVCDNFSDKGKDPIGGSAWRNFPQTVGADQIDEVPWDGFFPAAMETNYLWGFGSGGGSYYYSTGVGSSDDFATNDLNVVFTMFMGSYFGDWNNESNFLRASLGSGNILSASYSGFPQSLYFPMAMGETLGYCIRLTQNNLPNTTYAPWDQGQGEVHVALLGDPTLRLYPVKPPANLVVQTGAGTAALSWSPSGETNLAGYCVYRASGPHGPFVRVSSELLSNPSFSDAPGAGMFRYLVRAVRLEVSPSGTYFNPSQGILAEATVSPPPVRPVALQAHRVSPTGILLEVTGLTGGRFRIESSEDFVDWTEVSSGSLSSTSSEFPMTIDPTAGRKVFRAVSLP